MKNQSEEYPQNTLLGVSLIVTAALAISIQDVVFKLFSSELTLWQIFSLRGIIAVPVLLIIGRVRGTHRSIVREALSKWPLLRSLFITTTFLAFYAAIPFLSLSTVGAANYIAPIFVTLLSAYVIKEAVGPFGWLGVCIGFIGVIVLLQPGTDAFSPWAVLPILGAAFYALAHITTRVKCQSVSLAAMTLSLNIVMLLAGIIISGLLFWLQPQGGIFEAYPYIFGVWFEVSPWDWMIISVLAGFSIVIGMLLAGAYQAAHPSTISTFEYSYLVFVAIWDVFFFEVALSTTSLAGMTLIVIAGLLVLRRKNNYHPTD
ncbi:MAG: DMT family transporter [Chloroflexota bacterium]